MKNNTVSNNATEFKIGSVTFKVVGHMKGKNIKEIKVSGGLFFNDTLYLRNSRQTSEYFIEFVSSEDGELRKMLVIPVTDPEISLRDLLKIFLEKFENLI